MFPTRADLHVAPFRDDALYMEQYNKANFWCSSTFHGVDLSALRAAAMKEYFRQPIVDTFDIRCCISRSVRHTCDFIEAHETDLHKISTYIFRKITEIGVYTIRFSPFSYSTRISYSRIGYMSWFGFLV